MVGVVILEAAFLRPDWLRGAVIVAGWCAGRRGLPLRVHGFGWLFPLRGSGALVDVKPFVVLFVPAELLASLSLIAWFDAIAAA